MALLYALKKIVTYLFLPPGICVLFFCFLGWRLCRVRKPLRGWCAIGAGALLWFLSTGTGAGIICLPLERGLAVPSHPRGDVIILLGGGTYDDVPDLTGRGTPSDDMLFRVVTAARIYREFPVPVLVSGRDGTSDLPSDRQPVERFLVDLGVLREKIIIENESRDTAGNARNCREICRRRGFRNPILVTSAFHMRRSVQDFKRVGITVTPLPAHFRTTGDWEWNWSVILSGLGLPTSGALHVSCLAMKEYLGLLSSRLPR